MPSASSLKRPNVLIVMTDQQRADTCPPWGRAKMPRLEAYAKNATAFTSAYCPSPHCCPSRASFFTSKYPTEHGVRNNVLNSMALTENLADDIPLWSDALLESGYSLHFNGKWHVSKDKDPKDYGWQQGVCGRLGSNREEREGAWDLYKEEGSVPDAARQPGDIVRPGYATWHSYGTQDGPDEDRAFADDAIATIRRNANCDQPWCHYVGFIGPHDPYIVEQEFLDLYDDDDVPLPSSYVDRLSDKPNIYERLREQVWDQLSEKEARDCLKHYLAYCSKMDRYFGELIDVLQESDQAENTIVLFCSDHGDYASDHGLWCKGIAAFDSAYRVPLIASLPDAFETHPGTNDAFVSLCDIGPTILDACNASFSPEQFTGRSLMPLLRGETPSDWRQSICFQCDGVELYYTQRAITAKKWKYVFNGFDFDELYDRENDPHEMTNLARKPEYNDTVKSLCQELWTFASNVNDTPISSYITVGLSPNGPRSVYGPVNTRD